LAVSGNPGAHLIHRHLTFTDNVIAGAFT